MMCTKSNIAAQGGWGLWIIFGLTSSSALGGVEVLVWTTTYSHKIFFFKQKFTKQQNYDSLLKEPSRNWLARGLSKTQNIASLVIDSLGLNWPQLSERFDPFQMNNFSFVFIALSWVIKKKKFYLPRVGTL